MIEWNERQMKELIRKMGLKRVPGQAYPPLYGSVWNAATLLTKVMQLHPTMWTAALGYDETDRVSLVRYWVGLGHHTIDAFGAAAQYRQPLSLDLAQALVDGEDEAHKDHMLSMAAEYQRPLSIELTKLLIDAGAFDKYALSVAAQYQHPLTLELAKLLLDVKAVDESVFRAAARCQQPLPFELAKLLMDAGCDPTAQDGNGWDAFVLLARSGHPVDPQVTDLFLSAGCRRDLDGCRIVITGHGARFDQILAEHAQWKENLSRMSTENSLTGTFYGPDWGR